MELSPGASPSDSDAAYAEALQAIVGGSATEAYAVVAERYLELIARWPQRVETYQSLALYACLCGQLAAAQLVIDEALAMAAGQARSHYIKARICDEALDPAGSIAHYQQSLALDPANPKCRFNLGLAQLTAGDFTNGTANYSSRFGDDERAAVGSTPQWTPGDGHRRVLIRAEQGLGDELMFARLLPCLQGLQSLPDAVDTPVHFTLQCDRRLISTFRLNHPWLDFVARGDVAALLPGFDAQLAIGDLLGLFHQQLEMPAVRSRVLQPLPRADIEQLMPAPDRPGSTRPRSRIGISWLSMNAEYGALRSLPLQQLLDAFDAGRHVLVNLQYLAPPEHLQAIRARGFELVDGVDAFDDIEGLAALTARCDAVVSIDNSTLHLAGALGVKTWALIPRLPNWRWLLDTPRSAWYPSVTLLRQATAFDWSAELAALRLP